MIIKPKWTIALLVPFLFSTAAYGLDCKTDERGIVKYEQDLLKAADHLPKNEEKFQNDYKIPFGCLLSIYLNSDGFLKVVAAGVLRPFLGGPQAEGMPSDERYRKVFKALKKYALLAPSFARALGETHASATWDFYKMFCEENEAEKNIYCAEMLPSSDLVTNQSVFESVSSILLLKKAYQKLEGQESAQRKVAEKIKETHEKISSDDHIQKMLIEEIYQEIFRRKKIPLSRA